MSSYGSTRCGLATKRRVSCSRRSNAFALLCRRNSRFTSFNAASRPSAATARHTSAVPPLPSSSTARQLPRFSPFGRSTAVDSDSVASAWVRIGGFRRRLPLDRRRPGGLGGRLSLDGRRFGGARRVGSGRGLFFGCCRGDGRCRLLGGELRRRRQLDRGRRRRLRVDRYVLG